VGVVGALAVRHPRRPPSPANRARRFDLEVGGRFDTATADRTELVGAFCVRAHAPTGDEAAIWRLGWNGWAGGSEAEVRRAIAVLGAPGERTS
jgi:hypothetical protein